VTSSIGFRSTGCMLTCLQRQATSDNDEEQRHRRATTEDHSCGNDDDAAYYYSDNNKMAIGKEEREREPEENNKKEPPATTAATMLPETQQQQQQQQVATATDMVAAMMRQQMATAATTTATLPVFVPEPIDFEAMWKEERRKARRELRATRTREADKAEKQKKKTTTTTTTTAVDTATTTLPEWNLEDAVVPSLDSDRDAPGASATAATTSGSSSIRYRDRFLPPEYRRALTEWLLLLPSAAPQQQQQQEPELNCWHELPHAKRRVAVFVASSGTGAKFPEPLRPIAEALRQVFPAKYPPNHFLVNEYEPSQGILPHADGPAYYPTTATVSMGDGDVLLNFVPRTRHGPRDDEEETGRNDRADDNERRRVRQVVLSGDGSLVTFSGEAYTDCLHSIEDGVLEETAGEVSSQPQLLLLPGTPSSSPPPQQDDGPGNGGAGDDIVVLNAPPGTRIRRRHRISITVRHKF